MLPLVFVYIFYITLLAFNVICQQILPSDRRTVENGNANIEDYPYQLSLQYFGQHVCGASIISPTKALTAAHCTNKKIEVGFAVRAGSSQYFRGELTKVISVCQHPNFEPQTNYNDVSVLLLELPITISLFAQPIRLMSPGDYIPIGTLANITGWGKIEDASQLSLQLQQAIVPRIEDAVCRTIYEQTTPLMMCFEYPEGKGGAYIGDIGGPLVINGIQIGITSRGLKRTETGHTQIYTKVGFVRNHVDQC